MTRRATFHRSMAMIVLVAAAATACTTASPRMIGSGDVVADRQRAPLGNHQVGGGEGIGSAHQ